MLRKRDKVCKLYTLENIWSAVLLYGLLTKAARAYNIDVSSPVVFKGLSGSLFGYSVLLHSNEDEKWLVVGAPQSNITSNVNSPGVIYRCRIGDNPNKTCDPLRLGNANRGSCGKTCLEEQDNQWLGVSLSRQATKNGKILACGHRWKNIYYMKVEHKLPHGICYGIPSNFRTDLSSRFYPCYRDYVRKFGDGYGSCQAGISSFYTEDLIILGAPGSYYWTGSVFVYNTTENTFKSYVDTNNSVQFGSYLGYSVGAGHFLRPNSYEVIGGAPQQEQIGKVYIFTYETKQLLILFEAKGKKIGSYFGAAVCAVDLNSDGLSDLLVGAPMQSTVREEGRVYVFMNTGGGKMKELDIELSGSDLYAARFGETITNLGDIDNDGFEDVAIGAPQEDDLQGAVYIYNGREKGITVAYSQRIVGSQFGYALSMFGQSVSGGLDADGNGYQDVAIGAFLSDSAVLLRTRPVVIVDASLKLPTSVNRTKFECIEHGQPAVCMNVTVCYRYQGLDVPGYIVLHYNISSDIKRKPGTPARFYFISNGTSDGISGTIEIYHKTGNCKTHQVFMRKDVRDILTPVHMESHYYLGKHIVYKRSADEMEPLQPILQQKEGMGNVLRSSVSFARYCALANCSADLQITGQLSFSKLFENKTYLAVGSMRTIMINVSLYNAGDDAYQSTLQMHLPKGIYFTKVLDLQEKQMNCAVNDEDDQLNRLDCNVGHFYVDSLSKHQFSFLLDASSLTRAEDDLNITITVNCENEMNEETLWNNALYFMVPTRYEVQLNVIGKVTPLSFVFGPSEEASQDLCKMEKITYSFNVINVGLSLAPAAQLEIMIPNTFAPNDMKLFKVTEVKSTAGECYFKNYTKGCETQQNSRSKLGDLFAFISMADRRVLYCMKEDHSCLQIICSFGDMESEDEATVEVHLEINPSHLENEDYELLQFLTTVTAGSGNNSKVININQDQGAYVLMEALHNQKPKRHVIYLIIIFSLLSGVALFLLLTYALWKVGFFKRKYKPIEPDSSRRQSWNYVNKEDNTKEKLK
ncbi:integrin alpha-4 [Bombina bombina]|uniref:integrin alpha-4 n=1 Tax=Bombina bombina TaxID=8345 RepID=UPI00235B13E2|nr:integrin alpha-4 [Bombina bombina]